MSFSLEYTKRELYLICSDMAFVLASSYSPTTTYTLTKNELPRLNVTSKHLSLRDEKVLFLPYLEKHPSPLYTKGALYKAKELQTKGSQRPLTLSVPSMMFSRIHPIHALESNPQNQCAGRLVSVPPPFA